MDYAWVSGLLWVIKVEKSQWRSIRQMVDPLATRIEELTPEPVF
jgi:hypothetical protein